MDLKTGMPLWPQVDPLPAPTLPLQRDARCDVAIVGAGISAALVAHALADSGRGLLVLDRRDVGCGSTAASTALIQYEFDVGLVEMAARIGERDAAAVYLAARDAIDTLARIAATLGNVGFARRHSLYLASREADAATLQAEQAARRDIALAVQWLDRDSLVARTGIDRPAALWSRDGAVLDPYRFTCAIFDRLRARGTPVHAHTEVVAIDADASGVRLATRAGPTVHARHAIVAAGYESECWLPTAVATNHATYAFATSPLPDGRLGPLRDSTVWETARPYLYLRGTPDGRVVAGGADDPFDDVARRDRCVGAKAQAVRAQVQRLLPGLPLEIACAWAGTFAETPDGLPRFGAHPALGERVLFALGYGGNGIAASCIGADILRATLEDRAHPLAGVLSLAKAPPARDAGRAVHAS